MASVAILANGSFPRKAYPRYILDSADYVICCDGALEKYLRHSAREPYAVVGDLDSLSPSLRKKYAHLVHGYACQDTNDQTKAVRFALENIKDIDYIYILGATGGRADHTIGNLSLLMEYATNSQKWLPEKYYDERCTLPRIEAVTDDGSWFAVCESCELHVGKDRSMSIFTSDSSLSIHSEGLVWPLDGVKFDNWWKATLNRSSADIVKLSLSHPAPVLIFMN